VILSATLFGYSTSGAVLTLVLPLGLFIVVMIGMSVVFRRPRTMPGRQPVAGRAVPRTAARAREDRQPDGDDTAVSDTIVTDTAGDAGDPATTGRPEVPE
jgi:hypothetical protein